MSEYSFSWERQAQRGEEMPENISFSDKIIYLELRNLYAAVRNKVITRETAVKEKKLLMEDHRQYVFQEEMREEWVEVIKATEQSRSEFRKNPTIENAEKLVEIIEGRKNRD